MGFSGGGSNVLLPHSHDGRVSQDGGPLNFNSITQSQSLAGEVFYSDGTALQQLAYPAVPAGESLTAVAASTAPSWAAAASGAKTQLIGSTILGGAASSISLAFGAVDQSTVSEVFCILNAQKTNTAGEMHLKVNGLASNYNIGGMQQQGAGAPSSTQRLTISDWLFDNRQQRDVLVKATITCNACSDNLLAMISSIGSQGTNDNAIFLNTAWNTTAAQTSFDEIEFSVDSGNFATNSRLDVYKLDI